MHGRTHFKLGEELLQQAKLVRHDDREHGMLIAEGTLHALLARAAAEPGRDLTHEWCDACDGSGYCPPGTNHPPQAA